MRWVVLVVLLAIPVEANIFSEVEKYSEEVRSFVDDNTVIVLGKHMSKTEKMAMAYIKEKYPEVAKRPVCYERDCTAEQLSGSLILIGGPEQNVLTHEYKTQNLTFDTRDLTFGVLSFATADNGQKFMFFYDNSGKNLRKHPERSPLSSVIPPQFVPAAATMISLFLLWMWKFLLPFFKKILRLIVSSKLMKYAKKEDLKWHYHGLKVKGIRIKFREWIAIIGSAFVFAVAISHEYWGFGITFIALILTNLIVNSIIYAIRHFVRLYMDKVHELHTEYKLWFWGALVTIVSGWLGNTFAMAGYITRDRPTKREARIQYMINSLSFAMALVFLIWNFLSPSLIMQMATVLAMAISVVQMLPMKPFAGQSIYKWRRVRWWITFIPMFLIYMFLHLII